MPKKTAKGASAAGAAPRDLDILREMVELLDSSTALTLSYQRGDATFEVSRAGSAALEAIHRDGHVSEVPQMIRIEPL